MTKEGDSRNISELITKDVKSIEKFLPSQFVAWSGAPRIHHYFQVWWSHSRYSERKFTEHQLDRGMKRSKSMFSLDGAGVDMNGNNKLARYISDLELDISVVRN